MGRPGDARAEEDQRKIRGRSEEDQSAQSAECRAFASPPRVFNYVHYKAPMTGQRLFLGVFFGQWPKAGPEDPVLVSACPQQVSCVKFHILIFKIGT